MWLGAEERESAEDAGMKEGREGREEGEQLSTELSSFLPALIRTSYEENH